MTIETGHSTVKKKPKKKKEWGKIILLCIILVLFLIVFSMCELGTEYYQSYLDGYHPDEKYDTHRYPSWAPSAQWRIAKIHYFMGRCYLAAFAYNRYYSRYPNVNRERTAEAEYMELASYRDGMQYKRCYEAVQDYLDKYESKADDPIIKPWYEKASALELNMQAMPESKRYNHPIY